MQIHELNSFSGTPGTSDYFVIDDGSTTRKINATGLLNMFYPVGSFYETSDRDFDPNTAWGGTWVRETEGLVHIGSGSSYAAGSTGGAKTHKHTTASHTLTVNEIPSHAHNIYAHNNASATTGYGIEVTNAVNIQWTANRISSTGGGAAHNHGDTGNASNLPPYVVVNRWHRTA